MALAAGIAAYGAGMGQIQNEARILTLFVGAVLAIEILHQVLIPLGIWALPKVEAKWGGQRD